MAPIALHTTARAPGTQAAPPAPGSRPPGAAEVQAWLQAAFGDETLRVARLDCQAMGGGQLASTLRLLVHLAAPAGGPPLRLVCKLPSANPTTRAAVTAMGLYRTELEAYRNAGLLAGVDTPRCLHAGGLGFEDGFVLLLEDITPARQVSHQSACDEADLLAAIGAAAALHRSARGQFADAMPSFLQEKQRREIQNLRLLPMAVQRFKAMFGHTLAAEDLAIVDALARVYPRALQFKGRDLTLQHGDFRLQNLLFDARSEPGRVCVLDWQTLRLGHGMADLASLLGGSLEPERRRRNERELLAFYGQALQALGDAGSPADALWLDYRRWAVYALGSTLLSLVLMQDESQSEDFLILMRRHLRQVADLESLALWMPAR